MIDIPGLTFFTFINAVLCSNIFIILLFLLTRSPIIFRKVSLAVFFLIIFLCIIRILFPVEFLFTHVVNVSEIYPFLWHILAEESFYSIKIWKLILLIYLITTILIFIKRVITYNRIKKILSSIKFSNDNYILSCLDSAKKLLMLNKQFGIIINENITSPAIFGYNNPIILLPKINFSQDELVGILLHELIHYKKKHIFIKFIAEIIEVLLWWNIPIYIFNEILSDIIEFYTDKNVISLMGNLKKESYINAIVSVIENTENNSFGYGNISLGLAENNRIYIIKQRLYMILRNGYYSYNKTINFLICLVTIFLFITSYAFVFQPYSEPNESDYGIKNPDNGWIISNSGYAVRNGKYYELYDMENNHVGKIGLEDIKDEFFSGYKIIEER